ncbi:tyrosine-type recombinase/integrase [Streptomyces sp. NPDC001552]|uniref:tyrosine-type recombinase/integrase n=1 Tax=Streptomyces sp. NPDC001552 TaxID=3364587 RepID=UPI003684945A
MATVVPREDKNGNVSSYQVKWRLGGSGPWQVERFADLDDMPKALAAAEVFKEAVNQAKQQWPPGWIKGRGHINAETMVEERYRFDLYAKACVEKRPGSRRYKGQRLRALEMYLNPTFGNCDVRSAEHFCQETIGAWLVKMGETRIKRGSKWKLMSPGTIRMYHGLLYQVMNTAVYTQPPLRPQNPCKLSVLPKGNDWGVDDDESTDEMEFMDPAQIAGLVSCLDRPMDKMLVRLAFGTGLRWGEISALQGKHVRSPRTGEYEVRVTRAWKRDPGHPWKPGPPKSEAGRRTVEITAGLWQELQEFGLSRLEKDDLLFHDGAGARLPYSTFYDRFMGAVVKAKKAGLMPDWKFPTFHDIRHSHVAVLLSESTSLLYVQRRLGHESMKTTADRYGHLLETAHKVALGALDRAMGGTEAATAADVPAAPQIAPVRAQTARVHVAHVGPHRLAFEFVGDAEDMAQRWALETGSSVRVEAMAREDWTGTTGRTAAEVRDEMPSRALIWSIGPAVYAADGSEVTGDPAAQEPSLAWRWDFEPDFTEEAALHVVEQRRPPAAQAARAWGRDKAAVLSAYAQARADALRACGGPVVAAERVGAAG